MFRAITRTVLFDQTAPRDIDTLWNTIGQSMDRFSSGACANYRANSGYPRMM